MCVQCDTMINKLWRKLATGERYRTPDLYRGTDFNIEQITSKEIKITPQNITITNDERISTVSA